MIFRHIFKSAARKEIGTAAYKSFHVTECERVADEPETYAADARIEQVLYQDTC